MDEQTFSGSLVYSGVALLKWFIKSSRFEEGFNDKLLWSLPKFIQSRVINCVCTTSQEVSVTRYGVKRKDCAYNTIYAVPGFIAVLQIPVIQIIKIATFNMNPEFTEITLNSFNFVRDIFFANLARKLWIIDITHIG